MTLPIAAPPATPAPRPSGLLRWLPTVVVVTGVVATVIGLVVVDQLGDRTRNVIDLTVEAAEVAEAAADPVSGLPAELAALAEGVSASLAGVQQVADAVGITATALAEALSTNVASIATATADVADRVAAVIETIERFIPGNTASLAEELRQLADGLEPVPEQLAAIGAQLETAVEDLDEAAATIDGLEVQLGAVVGELTDAALAVQDLPALAADVRLEAEDARESLDGTLWLFRLLILVTGAAVVAVGICLRSLAAVVMAGPGTA